MAENKKSTNKNVKKKDGRGDHTGKNLPSNGLKTIMQDEKKREFMAKVVHNAHEFFKVGLNPVKSNDELCERLNYFFAECERTQQLPTVEKMTLCIGYPWRTVMDWCAGTHIPLWGTEATSHILKKAKQIMAAVDAELAQEGKIQPVVYMFRSKNYYDMKDQTEYVLTPNVNSEENPDQLISDAKMLIPEQTETSKKRKS